MPSILLYTAEVALRLGICPRQVSHLAAAGRIIGAQKIGRDWVFTGDPVVVPPPRPVGRPRKITKI